MTTIYEATCYPLPRRDFSDKAEAIAFVESNKAGRIVTFVKGFDGRERSAGMEVFENGAWRGINIHE